MSLLDSLLGAVSGNSNNGAQDGGGLAALIGMVSARPELLQMAASLLGNDGSAGGLDGLSDKFRAAGLGDVIASWIGSGQNQPISADQLQQVLGSDAIAGMAGKLGLEPADMAGQLSSILPGLVDRLTPGGQQPSGGLGNAGDLMGVFGSLLQR